MTEVWLPIKGFEDYTRISNFGRVWSIKTNKERAVFKSAGGYYHLDLFNDKKQHKNYTVHRLVAEAFIPNPNNLPYINHIDGNKLNNCVNNLEWCTPMHNARHAQKLGLCPPAIGEKNGLSKLKTEEVEFIKTRFKSPYSAIELAKRYNVSSSLIYKILQEKAWRHI